MSEPMTDEQLRKLETQRGGPDLLTDEIRRLRAEIDEGWRRAAEMDKDEATKLKAEVEQLKGDRDAINRSAESRMLAAVNVARYVKQLEAKLDAHEELKAKVKRLNKELITDSVTLGFLRKRVRAVSDYEDIQAKLDAHEEAMEDALAEMIRGWCHIKKELWPKGVVEAEKLLRARLKGE